MGSCKSAGNIRKCNRETYQMYDFCKYHYHKHVYNKKILDFKKNTLLQKSCENYINMFVSTYVTNKFHEIYQKTISALNDKYICGLLGIYDSWIEIPIIYWIKIDNIWWDMRILNNIFTVGINQSEMEGPYPIYPCNPYTRALILPNDLKLFRKKCIVLNIKINIAFDVFLNLPLKTLTELHQTTIPQRTYNLVNILSKKLRFKLVNYKNSQNCYCGYWVHKREKKSTFEQLYYVINNTSCYCGNDGVVIGDTNHLYALMLIDDLKPEQYTLVCD